MTLLSKEGQKAMGISHRLLILNTSIKRNNTIDDIMELMKARIAEARLKEGYEVKGDGSVILYGKENTK